MIMYKNKNAAFKTIHANKRLVILSSDNVNTIQKSAKTYKIS